MAVLIKSNEQKSITILGTTLNVENVYGRLEFAGRADGKTLEIAVTTYASYETFLSNQPIFTDVQQGSFNVEIATTETQSIDTANKYAKLAFEQLGYTVDVI